MFNSITDGNVGCNDFTDSIKTYYSDLSKYPPIPRDVERDLMRKAKNGDIEARNKIISANLRFVFDIAKKYRGRGVDIADLISEGNKGIIKAIEKFDMSKDVKFFTYAVWWVRQHMSQAIEEQLERDMKEVCFDEEFPAENKSIEDAFQPEDDDMAYYNGRDIADADMGDAFDEREEENQKQFVVRKLLATLDDRERFVVMKYFGIGGDERSKNLEQISGEMHLSTERVRQIKVRAINKMRNEAFDIEEAEFLFD